MTDMAKRLDPVTMGLGASYGYSGADLTNLRRALDRGELPFRKRGATTKDALELRIHGVGGAPPTDNLESPAVLQVAGDGNAGFYRAWYPGGSATGMPRQEAYCWGKLNYHAWWSAFWLLLLPFGLVNVAHWALPATGAKWLRPIARGLLRLLALVLTAGFVATAGYLMIDVVAWQAAQRDQLWSWLQWYQRWSVGGRMALAAAVVFAVIAGLWWLSCRTQGAYEARESGYRAPDDPEWALSDKTMWCGERPVGRQRSAHLIISAAVLMFILALPHVSSASGLRSVLLVAAVALAAVAVLIVLVPWTDRLTRAGAENGTVDKLLAGVSWAALAGAAAVAIARIWWQPVVGHDAAIPYDALLQIVLLFASFGAAFLVGLAVLAQAPWRQRNVMGGGCAAVGIALLATLIAGIFGAILLLTVSNMLAKPKVATSATPTAPARSSLYLPSTVYASGFALLVAIAAAVIVGGCLYFRARSIAKQLATVELGEIYQGRGADPDTDEQARRAVARTWSQSRLTDYAAVALFAVTVPTFAALLTEYALVASKTGHIGALTSAATIGTSIGVLAVGAFIAYVRSALQNTAARRRFGFFWDVMTFWPRACHPLGPPCYAERSVPEVVTRIRRVVGDITNDDDDPAVAQQVAERFDQTSAYLEQHSPVLLVGYSQGCPIATAVVAQLPEPVRNRVALLTLASPAHRLYGRAFPAYFGTRQLAELEKKLTDDGTVRWVNLVRRSDYIGGWARSADLHGVDREIYDPPVLWQQANPAPPPIHRHSDWFPDPQTRPAADALSSLLTQPRRRRPAAPDRPLADALAG